MENFDFKKIVGYLIWVLIFLGFAEMFLDTTDLLSSSEFFLAAIALRLSVKSE